MGGRGGSSGISAVQKNVERSELWESTVQFQRGRAEKLKKSPYFMGNLKDAISKEAFMQGKEITTNQVDKIANNMLGKLDKPKRNPKRADLKSKKPDGMSKDAYERYKKDGFSDSEISSIWKSTESMRSQMKKNAETRKKYGEREITSSTYKSAMNRTKRNVDRWLRKK